MELLLEIYRTLLRLNYLSLQVFQRILSLAWSMIRRCFRGQIYDIVSKVVPVTPTIASGTAYNAPLLSSDSATLTIHGKGFPLPLTGIKVYQTSNLTKGQGTLTVTSNATNQFSNVDFVYKADGVLVGKVSGVQSTTLTFTGGTPANTQADVVNDEPLYKERAKITLYSGNVFKQPGRAIGVLVNQANADLRNTGQSDLVVEGSSFHPHAKTFTANGNVYKANGVLVGKLSSRTNTLLSFQGNTQADVNDNEALYTTPGLAYNVEQISSAARSRRSCTASHILLPQIKVLC